MQTHTNAKHKWVWQGKCHNHRLKTNPRHREEETKFKDSQYTAKVSDQQDDCYTRKGTKSRTTKQGPLHSPTFIQEHSLLANTCIQTRTLAPLGSYTNIGFTHKQKVPSPGGGGALFFFFIRRLGPSIYRSPQKDIRIFKQPQKYLNF